MAQPYIYGEERTFSPSGIHTADSLICRIDWKNKKKFGKWMENDDLHRWHNTSVSVQTMYEQRNTLTGLFRHYD